MAEEEEKREIDSSDAVEVLVESDNVVSQKIEEQHESTGEDSSDESDPNTPDIASEKKDAATNSQGGKRLNRFTAVLVLAVVALTATIAVVVPVLVAQNSGGTTSEGGTTAASKEVTPGKEFGGGSDRQVVPNPTPPPTLASRVPSTEKPSFNYPSFDTYSPSPYGFPPVSTECPSEIECNGRPCAFLGLGDSDFGCCDSWNIYELWDESGSRWKNYCYNSFPLGAPCIDSYNGDYLCQSNICHNGKCANSRGEVGEPCIENRNCTNGCGKQSLNSSTYSCCRSYETYIEGGMGMFYDMYCAATVEVDGDCIGDEMCQSYICIDNKCAASRLSPGDDCSTHNQCDNYACALPDITTSQKVCCPSYSYYGEQCANTIANGEKCFADELCQSGICINETATEEAFCSDERLPDGSLCYQDNHCQNYACGYNSFELPTANQNKTCCTRGRYEYVHVEPWNNYVSFCAGSISEGESCDADRSGNVLCETGKCVQGVCASERLSTGESCDYNQDCRGNACGFDSIDDASRRMVCCEREAIGFYNSIGYELLCSRIVPTGGSCDMSYDGYENNDDYYYNSGGASICQSGICIQGVCADDRLDDGEDCNRNSECTSQACAFSLFDFADRKKICCIGNEVQICDNYSCESYCERTVPSGGSCPTTDGFRVCQSGICIDGVCRDDRLADGESCKFNNDCDAGACGFDSVVFGTREKICCPSGETVWLYDQFDYAYYCARVVPVNGSCLSGEDFRDDYGNSIEGGGAVCETGICIDGSCASTRLPDLSPCTNHNACDSHACGLSSLDGDKGEKVCCESICSHQLYDGFSYDDYCVGIQDVGEPCTWSYGRNAQNYPQLCSTGICVDGSCATELVGYNETCSTGTDCISGACGHPSLDMDSEKLCCDWTDSIYDGICGYDEFCANRIPAGEPCKYRGLSYDSLCQSYYCTSEGVCSNETSEEWPYPEEEHDHEDEGWPPPYPEEEMNTEGGDQDGDHGYNNTNTTVTYGNLTMGEGHSNHTGGQDEDHDHTDTNTTVSHGNSTYTTNYTIPGN